MRGHPAVAEVAVFGVPSDRWGETPIACVVLEPGAAASVQGLLEWTNRQLGKAQRLATIEAVSSLPRSDIGKVLKRQLRETYTRTHGAAP
jgi:long-chain acyl-CoA synthetase